MAAHVRDKKDSFCLINDVFGLYETQQAKWEQCQVSTTRTNGAKLGWLRSRTCIKCAVHSTPIALVLFQVEEIYLVKGGLES